MKIMVTGGAGFIGSALIRRLVQQGIHEMVIVDSLTYAGSLSSIGGYDSDPAVSFYQIDICSSELIVPLILTEAPDVIVHMAAESHVDRSISGPRTFIDTNVIGTYNLLQASRLLLDKSDEKKRAGFRFVHVSTDEVYGDLGVESAPFTEQSVYRPSSPYSATKAASDHLVRAWGRTYGLPYLITNCSNNYGPFQHPEKLIPKVIISALTGKAIPVYGTGQQQRDWLFVDDHVDALLSLIDSDQSSETFNIGSGLSIENLVVVKKICACLERLVPESSPLNGFSSLIEFVADRAGHDQRYALDASRIRGKVGWTPSTSFDEGLELTVGWYISNATWWECAFRRSVGL